MKSWNVGEETAAIYMHSCESPVHWTSDFTSPPKDGILSWFNYPILNVS